MGVEPLTENSIEKVNKPGKGIFFFLSCLSPS
jgi:hypothetical protein